MYANYTRFNVLVHMAILLVCFSACDDDTVVNVGSTPNLVFQSPLPDATAVGLSDTILAAFDQEISSFTLDSSSFWLSNVTDSSRVPGAASLGIDGDTLYFIPDDSLEYDTEYEVNISSTVSSVSNKNISATTWRFTTVTLILPTPRGIEGEYKGMLFITESATGGGAKKTDSMPVTAEFRLGLDNQAQEGTYAHVYDTTVDTLLFPKIFCDITQGTWFTRDGKIFLAPGPTDPGSVCDPTIVPNSFIEPAGGGEIIEVGFGPIKLKLPPLENEIGDSLVLRQIRFDADRETVFRLELLSIPIE